MGPFVLLIGLLVCADAQIIFPDEFEKMQKAHRQRPFPSAPSNSGYEIGPSPSSEPNLYQPNVSPSAYSTPKSIQESEAQYWSNHVNKLIARGITKFTLDMDAAIDRSQGVAIRDGDRANVIFSPLSLAVTLAMVLLGSAGVTFDQVSKILGLESGVDITSHSVIVHQMLGLLIESIHSKGVTGPRALMASGMFVQEGYPIRPEFLAVSQKVYHNEVINLDFINRADEATKKVNDWVKQRTQGKIQSILTQPVDPETKFIIASALYFNGEWDQYFIKGATQRRPFHITSTESIEVDMMYNSGEFPFYEDKQFGVKIIGLPYKGYDPAATNGQLPYKYQAMMYVLLPTSKAPDALIRLESNLTPEVIEDMVDNMKNRTCILGMPRMKLSSTLNLNEALASLGLSSLFDPRTANLGLLSPGFGAEIFSRSGVDNDTNNEGTPNATTGSEDLTQKKDYFRYEDKKGGYIVKQWGSGVIIEKIHRRRRKSREAEQRAATTTSQETESYGVQANSTDNVKVVGIGKNKYNFVTPREKRQSRPIDNDFVRFIESHWPTSKFGLDALRNSPDLSNPHIFASDVIHKVEMDVTETGTIGAAATAVTIQRGGDINRLLANRPFLFFIRHESSKLILFWGTVNKPTPNY